MAAGFGLVDEPRSPGDERRADAAFVKVALAAEEGSGGARARLRAVIGTDEDERIIAEAGGIADVVEEFAELPVHFPKHREVHFAFAIAELVHGRPERAMDVIRPQIDIKWFLILHGPIDEGQRAVEIAAGDFRTLHPGNRPAEIHGLGPDLAGLGVAGLEGQRKQFGAHALEVG